MASFQGAGRGRREVRILFTSAGRRIELIQAFTAAARALRLRPCWHTADVEPYIAAACVAEKSHRVVPVTSPGYISRLLSLVRRERIDLLVPLIDSDLLRLAEARERFADAGCAVMISSLPVVETCRDKLRTFQFLHAHGIDTPQTWTPAEIRRQKRQRFPYFLKPRFGSASKGNFVVRDAATLRSVLPLVPDAIVQEFVSGIEYTLDVWTGLDGVVRCVVPRERIEVRGGEVTKARTVKDRAIMAVGGQVAEVLGGCVGLITIQLIRTDAGRLRVIEVNPRFGGGVPLAIQAGADFPRWLLADWLGKPARIRPDAFQPGLLMLRYHQSFFLKNLTGKTVPQRHLDA